MLCGKFTCSLEPGVSFAEVVIIRVETDEGLVGYGESGTIGSYPAYAKGILANAAELIRHHLVALDPSNVNSIVEAQAMMVGQGYVKSAFDMACWDILGKSLGQPLWKLLGGKLQESVPLCRSITANTDEELLQGIDVWRGEGYRLFQLRAGVKSPKEDVEQLGAALSSKKNDESYIIDPAGRWSVADALYILRALRDFEFIVEQPCNSYRECVSLRERIDVPIKLDNVIKEPSDILQAHMDNACDAISIKISNLGGISAARFARDLSINVAMPATYETMWGTEISSAAITHLALTAPSKSLLGCYDIHNYTSYSTTKDEDIAVENGRMSFYQDKPGLGVEVDDAILGEPDTVIESA